MKRYILAASLALGLLAPLAGAQSAPVCDGGTCDLNAALVTGTLKAARVHITEDAGVCFTPDCAMRLFSPVGASGTLYYSDGVQVDGGITMVAVWYSVAPCNSSGTPGNAACTSQSGYSAVATDAGQAVITNTRVSNTTRVAIGPAALDTGCAQYAVTSFDGGFTLRCAAPPATPWFFSWWLWN
jgi:hypothetical protein